jgi:hypothetical protein
MGWLDPKSGQNLSQGLECLIQDHTKTRFLMFPGRGRVARGFAVTLRGWV